MFLSGILLGGTKSDYFNFIERDYNMGSGFYKYYDKVHANTFETKLGLTCRL